MLVDLSFEGICMKLSHKILAVLALGALAAFAYFNTTPRPQMSARELRRADWSKLTEEQKEERRAQRLAAHKAMTPDERRAKREARRLRWSAMNDEERAERRVARQARLAKMSEEELARRQERRKAFWDALTPEEQAEINARKESRKKTSKSAKKQALVVQDMPDFDDEI